MNTVDEIVRAARSLPKADQWRVWDELAATLEPEDDDPAAISEAWRAEIERRSAEIDAGTCELIPGDVVWAKARAILESPPNG